MLFHLIIQYILTCFRVYHGLGYDICSHHPLLHHILFPPLTLFDLDTLLTFDNFVFFSSSCPMNQFFMLSFFCSLVTYYAKNAHTLPTGCGWFEGTILRVCLVCKQGHNRLWFERNLETDDKYDVWPLFKFYLQHIYWISDC